MNDDTNLDTLTDGALAQIHGGASAVDAHGRVYQVEERFPPELWAQLGALALPAQQKPGVAAKP